MEGADTPDLRLAWNDFIFQIRQRWKGAAFINSTVKLHAISEALKARHELEPQMSHDLFCFHQ